MKVLMLCALLVIAVTTFAQITVTGAAPTNWATNVPTTTTLQLFFSAPLNPAIPLTDKRGLVTNVDSLLNMWYSADAETVYFQVQLKPSTDYVVLVYWVAGQGGTSLSTPYRYVFTTASSFSGHAVSGTVSGGGTGIDPGHSIVVFSTAPIGEDVKFIAGGFADAGGYFSVPNIPDGTIYPLAAKDLNGDGDINPTSGDALGQANPITISGSDVSGVTIALGKADPLTLAQALDSLNLIAPGFVPGDAGLIRIDSWDTDSLGRSLDRWEFTYFSPPRDSVYRIRINAFERRLEAGTRQQFFWLTQGKALPSTVGSAAPSVFVANCESAGGLDFRNQNFGDSLLFHRKVTLGHLTYTEYGWLVPDTSQYYWGAEYSFYRQVTRDSSHDYYRKSYIGDFTTGTVLVVNGVDDPSRPNIPASFALAQNYPNPFNPSTTIEYSLPVSSTVKLEIFNVIGQKVAMLADGQQSAGTYRVAWHPSVASGIYFYKLTATAANDAHQRFSEIRRMALIR